MSKAITTRQSLIEQSTQAAFKAFGSWKNLKALIIGSGFSNETDYLAKQGILAENITALNFNEEWENSCLNNSPDIVLISITNAEIKGYYSTFVETLIKLRNLTTEKRIICIENETLGYSSLQNIEDPTLSLKQIYLKVLKDLEEKMGKDYLSFHDKLLKENKSEDYEKRLVYIFTNDSVKKHLDNGVIAKDFVDAQILALLKDHSSKTFESGFIAGDDTEVEKILKLFKPKSDWKKFKESFPKNTNDKLCELKINKDQLDTNFPLVKSEIWNELESYAGQFFDLHCNKFFNNLDSAEKFILTNDNKYEEIAAEDEEESNSDTESNFRKFEVASNSLSGMMGANPLAGMMGGGPLGSSLSAPKPNLSSSKKYFNLKEYGETFLAMIAAWHRQSVYTGGALFEYAYKNDEDILLQGCVVTLAQNKDLLIQVNKLSETLDLPKLKSKIDPKKVLDIFFKFQKNYTNYYDKVRNLLKSNHDFYLGEIKTEDYETIKRNDEIISEKFEIDLKQRKEKKKKLQQVAENSKNALLNRRKSLKVSKIKEYLDSTDGELFEEILKINLTPEEAEELNQNLELKRLELEEHIENEKKKREELESAILQEKEARNTKRQEIELDQQRKKEALLQERLKRQQRLQEERKKREDVKQMRAKNLREAFDKAREAAIKKQENKLVDKPTGSESEKKKSEKKKFNPEAVKMMIRFGTNDKKIFKATGISEEELDQLKATVKEEDSLL